MGRGNGVQSVKNGGFWEGSGRGRFSRNPTFVRGAANGRNEPTLPDAALATNDRFDATDAIRCKDRHHLRMAHADGESWYSEPLPGC